MDATGDVAIRYCPSCSHPEHGNLACDYSMAYAVDWERSALPPSLLPGYTYRVMDDQLFVVHSGAPLGAGDHCCLCAFRERSRG